MKAFKVEQFGLGADVTSETIYSTVMPAGKLLDASNIDRWTRNNRDGYQRDTERRRVAKIRKWLMENVGVFGTSILGNVRNNIDFEPELEINECIQFGELNIPENETIWIIDGMHRIEGLKKAQSEDDRFKDYPVLISIFSCDNFREMYYFHIHNNTARKVKTDLSIKNMQKVVEKGAKAPKWALSLISTPSDHRMVQAAMVVEELDSEPPFQEKIRFPNDPEDPKYKVPDYKFERYIAEIFKEKTFELMDTGDVTDLLVQYWKDIEELYPEAFENWDSGLTKSAGLGAFSMIFPTVYAYAVNQGKPMEEMGNVLSALKEETKTDEVETDFKRPIEYETWTVRGPIIFRASSKRDISFLAKNLVAKINYVRERED